MTEARDPKKDLAVCEAATQGEQDIGFASHGRDKEVWRIWVDGTEIASFPKADDAWLFYHAREALPYWINRAVEAEAQVGELREFLHDLLGCVPLVDFKEAMTGVYLPVLVIQKARKALSNSRPAILDRVERLEKALREIEWFGLDCFPGVPCCCCCGNSQSEGHGSDCLIGQALKGGEV